MHVTWELLHGHRYNSIRQKNAHWTTRKLLATGGHVIPLKTQVGALTQEELDGLELSHLAIPLLDYPATLRQQPHAMQVFLTLDTTTTIFVQPTTTACDILEAISFMHPFSNQKYLTVGSKFWANESFSTQIHVRLIGGSAHC